MKLKVLMILSGILAFSLLSCNQNPEPKDYFTVHFNTCTDLETNIIPDQHLYEGDLVDEPKIITPMDSSVNKKASGWYTSSNYTTKWNFDTDVVTGDLNLYAKWADIHCIYYYLQGDTKPIWTVYDACVGDPLEQHDELCDGYEFLGYYQDASCTAPFDLEEPLYDDTIVYMKRGTTVDFNASSLKRRFVNFAASGTGSKAGSIGEVCYDEKGNEYVDVNFGYSTAKDPYIEISNPVLDISKSQKLKFRFKNLGGADSFSLYWVSKYADDTYAGGTRYYTGDNSINANNCNDVKLSVSERNMDPDKDVWIERTIDLSQVLKDGVSTWGNSKYLIKLRLQFGYLSKSESDLSNIIRFNYIKGVSDDTHVGFNDTQEIKDLCKDDDPAAIATAASKQSAITHGLRFPLNNDAFVSSGSANLYKKTDGVILYSTYGKINNKFSFTPVDEISADNYSYLRIRLSNYSYISTIDVNITTLKEGNKKVTGGSFTISPKQVNSTDYYLNLFEMENFTGTVQTIVIKFNCKGVDNAILINELEFQPTKSFQVPGINFNDNNCAGFVETPNISLERNASLSGTRFEVSSSGSTEATLNYTLDTKLYSTINISYFYPTMSIGQSMNKITISVKIGGVYYDYNFNDVTASNKIQSASLPYNINHNHNGPLQSVKITFNDRCVITIQKITFGLDEAESVDFSNSSVVASMISGWGDGLTYNNSISASDFSSSTSLVRYYFGNRFEAGFRKNGNIPLKGKSFVYFIYQKTDAVDTDRLTVILHGLKKTDAPSSYKTAVGSTQLMNQPLSLTKADNDASWSIGCIEIPTQYSGTEEDLWYCSQVSFTFSGLTVSSPNIAIRGIVIR